MNFLTEIIEGLKIAWDAIRANKMRSTLTTLGIVIGIVTVTLMGTAIDEVNRSFAKALSTMGANTMEVSRHSWESMSWEDWLRERKRRPITFQQAQRVARQMTLAAAVAPVAEIGQIVRYEKRSAPGVAIIGTTEQFINTSGFSIGEGRFFSAEEAEGGRPVCVVGLDVATNLFQTASPLGNKIKVGDRTFDVVGVLAKQGSFLGLKSFDNEVIVPIRHILLNFSREPEDIQIWVKAPGADTMEDTSEELHGLMRSLRHLAPAEKDDFAINRKEQLAKKFNKLTGIIASVGFVITGLSLCVGGIGIMNIMFVSVAERTREIGLRKAIGAKRRAILLQFLSEAAGICLLGGLFGLAITWAATLVISIYFPMSMSLRVMVMAILVSLVTGLISGFLPAWRAARMDPVEALRNE